MRILLVTPSLGFGGAERVMSLLARFLHEQGYEVTMLVLNGGRGQAYETPNTLVWSYRSVLRSLPALVRYLRTHDVDLVFSSARNVNYYLCLFRKLGWIRRLLIRDNNVIRELIRHLGFANRMFIRLLSGTYAWADGIICQSEDMRTDVLRNGRIRADRVHLIHNPANPAMSLTHGNRVPGRFVTVGRLDAEKGYERLIRSLSLVPGDWHWHIYGQGPLKGELDALVRAQGLGDRVAFKGTTRDMPAVFAEASVFLSGSYVEGFPNGILESVLSGVPVVAFTCVGGTREIVRHGVNGYLATDERTFAEQASESLQRDWDRADIAAEAASRFEFGKIMGRYEQVIRGLANA